MMVSAPKGEKKRHGNTSVNSYCSAAHGIQDSNNATTVALKGICKKYVKIHFPA